MSDDVKGFVELVELKVQKTLNGDRQLRDCIGVLSDGTRIQLPIIAFEDTYRYPDRGAPYDPKDHTVSLKMHGMRVKVVEDEGFGQHPLPPMEKKVLCEMCGSTTRTRCGRLGCV